MKPPAGSSAPRFETGDGPASGVRVVLVADVQTQNRLRPEAPHADDEVGPSARDSPFRHGTARRARARCTQSLAQSLTTSGIRVNYVAPGPAWTPQAPATLARGSGRGIRRAGADAARGASRRDRAVPRVLRLRSPLQLLHRRGTGPGAEQSRRNPTRPRGGAPGRRPAKRPCVGLSAGRSARRRDC